MLLLPRCALLTLKQLEHEIILMMKFLTILYQSLTERLAAGGARLLSACVCVVKAEWQTLPTRSPERLRIYTLFKTL